MIKIWNTIINSLTILIVSFIALKWLDIIMEEDDVE